MNPIIIVGHLNYGQIHRYHSRVLIETTRKKISQKNIYISVRIHLLYKKMFSKASLKLLPRNDPKGSSIDVKFWNLILKRL